MNALSSEIDRKYSEANRLQAVLFEITHRCPCNCMHCLLVRTAKDELSLEQIADLLRQLRVEGTINVGITGGEPFLREDLPQILELARKGRFFVSVLTTGILIDQAEVNLLRRHGIRHVEISLLGASSPTHDSIMRFPGAFNRTIGAARRLVEANITVAVKATIMRPNWQELPAMARIARGLGARFSASISIAPRVNGDPTPQRLALSEKEIAQLNPALIAGGPIPYEERHPGALLTCRAGRTVAGISPQGDIFPCILLRHKVGNIRARTVQDIWHHNPDEFLQELRRMKPADVSTCFACELRSLCRRCPGISYLENSELGGPSSSACAAARGWATATRKQAESLLSPINLGSKS